MTAIRTEGLTKRYGDVAAVRDVDLEVDRGEVFGFLGPNGAGKSTTIDMLLDFVRPTGGEIRVLGHDPRSDPRAVRERVGILPEGYDLYDRLSARRHVAFATELEGSDDDPDAVLARVGLADDADRAVGGFSKGMRQRLALAMALVGEPDLLVLDEPSGGLDPNGATVLRDLVREEADRGAAVFFSSHLMDQVEAVCDRVGIMNRGELLAVDTVDGLRSTSGSASTLVVSVDEVPDVSGLTVTDGVSDVAVEEGALRIACSDPGIKADVISRIEDAGASVTDIDVEETDLADLFAEYTNEARAREVDA
ncbi:ABC transporter ATP-binding protein [Halorarum salinum]|uniref:ABC transporter ATP-binding protein n=1 Tax=Halorarum salinum TaxID=2743089 RepID=A0A7D5QEH0_9EURY|nr:ABC transporter ATP-binding protein [Halobaculum salinum]QLG64239.1 ABC transporter ATP-binding protein [Halobaculum salinum]